MNNVSAYGYWGPYCEDPAHPGAFLMCHKGHGYNKVSATTRTFHIEAR
jgi:hypothetical protein